MSYYIRDDVLHLTEDDDAYNHHSCEICGKKQANLFDISFFGHYCSLDCVKEEYGRYFERMETKKDAIRRVRRQVEKLNGLSRK